MNKEKRRRVGEEHGSAVDRVEKKEMNFIHMIVDPKDEINVENKQLRE